MSNESVGESIFWSIVQGFCVFAVIYIVGGLVSPKDVHLGFTISLGLCWALGALIGRRMVHRK